MTELGAQTADRIRAEEELREQVRQEFWDERQAQASDRRKDVMLYLIPILIIIALLLYGYSLVGWPF